MGKIVHKVICAILFIIGLGGVPDDLITWKSWVDKAMNYLSLDQNTWRWIFVISGISLYYIPDIFLRKNIKIRFNLPNIWRTLFKKKAKTPIQEAVVPIKWNVSDDIITRFASNMTVQILENEFKISFFEMSPEILFNVNQDPPKEVQANCVASVIVSPAKLPSFITALQQQLVVFAKLKAEGIPENLNTGVSGE